MEEEKKSRKKRKVSIITVFLWLFLIVTMSVITIGSIRKQNAVENLESPIRINLDFSLIDQEFLDLFDEKIIEDEEFYNYIFAYEESDTEIHLTLKEKNNNIYVYEMDEMPTENFGIYLSYFDYYEDGNLLEFGYYKEIKIEDLKSEYTFQAQGEILKIEVIDKEFLRSVYLMDCTAEEAKNADKFSSHIIDGCYKIGDTEDKFLGVKYPLAKSFYFYSTESELYLGDEVFYGIPNKYGSYEYYIDLTDQNEYHFLPEFGTMVRVKADTEEGMERLKEKVERIEIYFKKDENNKIDLGQTYFQIDEENKEIRFLIQNYITEEQSQEITYLEIDQIFFSDGSRSYFTLEQDNEIIGLFNAFDYVNIQGLILPDEYNEFTAIFKYYSPEEVEEKFDSDTVITSSIKWVDKNTGKAEMLLGNTAYLESRPMIDIGSKAIYSQKLGDHFILSAEYENNVQWKILDSIPEEENNEEIPNTIFELFINNYILQYIYVKDSNTIYWYQFVEDPLCQSEPIHVIYQDFDNTQLDKKILNIYDEAEMHVKYFYDPDYTNGYQIGIKSPELGYCHLLEGNVTIEKVGKDGTYYIGLFEDETTTNTDKIVNIEVVDGSGFNQIVIEDFMKDKNYYLYEVDQNGNKIKTERYVVNFDDTYDFRTSEITTDKEIVSSVKSGIDNANQFPTDILVEESTGTGEADYVDNMLTVKDIYQTTISIGDKKATHHITYETEEGGSLEGDREETVFTGETPQNIPTPIPEKGYEFDKWIVVENGEEVEVNPSEYVVTKDVTFIAKFKKIDTIVDIDTSDIQVWVYVVVAIVAVVGIIVVVLIVRKNKTRK